MLSNLVYVVDDDPSVRNALGLLLSSADYDVLTFEDAQSFLDTAGSLMPGVVLSDIWMPRLDGLMMLQKMRESGVLFPFIAMTGHAKVSTAVRAMKLGAADFLEKPFDEGTLLSAIAGCQSGVADVGPMQTFVRRWDALSGREKQIFQLLTHGQTSKTIARSLSISHRTVELHRYKLMGKLGKDSLAELVMLATRSGSI